MKKTNFFKMVMTLVLAFAFSGASAQFVAQDSDAAEAIDSVTVGMNVPYYVEPDIYFNPGWAGTATDPDVAGLVNSTFVWEAPVPSNGATDAATPTGDADGDNYVQYLFPDVGTYSLEVTESAGSCPGSSVNMDVHVIAAPTMAFTSTDATYIGGDVTFCDGDVDYEDDIVQAAFTTSVRAPYSIQLEWTLQITTLQADQSTIDKYWDVDKVALGAPGFAYDYDGTDGVETQVTGLNALTYNLEEPTDGQFTSIVDGTPKTTVYTYTINGVNDRISRKSDYLANTLGDPGLWSWYGTAESIVITVNPAPVTGPIYHITNMWAN